MGYMRGIRRVSDETLGYNWGIWGGVMGYQWGAACTIVGYTII
jgi:hypothetical protein